MIRTYGVLRFTQGYWEMDCDPHVRMRAKRIFGKLKDDAGKLRIKETDDVCADLNWFLQRYPLQVSTDDSSRLNGIVADYQEQIARVDELIDGNYQPRQVDLAIPARDYQLVASEVLLAKGRLLLADDLGLGKTASAFCAMANPKALPCVVICPPILRRQWKSELARFLPNLTCHVIETTSPYELPKIDNRGPDVVIISYHAISNWVKPLSRYCSMVVFEEAGELRRSESQKYSASKAMGAAASYRLALSATPIHNYGGEIYNVMECVAPGVFGNFEEFLREWCPGSTRDKPVVKHPNALGAWMKSEHLMLRRTKSEVGRQLPELLRVTHTIDSDMSELRKVEGKAGELAKIILGESAKMATKMEEMSAIAQMNTLLRQATGLAKAPYVATFVDMLVESGEKVLLYGWHRAVYSVWLEKLAKYQPSFYTGSETDNQKAKQKERFVNGETPVMIMSLRSGIGLDGLQHVSRTVVFGELDWTPAVHEQCAGRLHRDGQTEPVTEYFLISNDGLDPMMAQVLGIKKGQVDGIRDDIQTMQRSVDSASIIRRMAADYLSKKVTA